MVNYKNNNQQGGRKKKKRCSKKRLRKNMICYKGSKAQLRRLRRKTRKLKAKLTKCSRRRLQKWKSTRQTHKKGRKRKGGKLNLCKLHLGSRTDSGPDEDKNVTQKEADEYCAKHYLADEDENGKNDGVERPAPETRDPAARMANKCSPAGTCLRKKGPGYTFNYSQGFYEKNMPLHEIYGSRRGAFQGGRKAGKTLKKRGGRHTKAKFMFNDGAAVYSKYDKKYIKHDKGYVILGPPGIGKTTFIRNQKGSKKDWIDQDDLFRDLGVKHHFNNKNKDDFRLNYSRADYMSEQTKLLGYRIIGALFWDYKADAIVIIPEKLHKQYLSKRKDLNLKTVMEITKYLREHAKKYNIPIFDNILDATKYLENLK